MILLKMLGAFVLAVVGTWALLLWLQRRYEWTLRGEFEDAYEDGDL